MIYQIAITFASMVVLDYIWAHYTIYLLKNKPWGAGVSAALIMIANALVTILYVDDHWMILPTAAGAFVGTFAVLKWKPPWLT